MTRLGTVLLVAAVLVGAVVATSVGIALFVIRRAVEPAEWMRA